MRKWWKDGAALGFVTSAIYCQKSGHYQRGPNNSGTPSHDEGKGFMCFPHRGLHLPIVTMKMSNLLTSDYSDFCTYQLCSFSSAQQPQDNITMEVLIFIFANGFNLQMNDLIFKSAMLQKTHQGILYCFWLTSSRAHWDVTFLGFGFSLQMDALISQWSHTFRLSTACSWSKATCMHLGVLSSLPTASVFRWIL